MSAITAEQLADLVKRLRAWTVDWDCSQMARGEPPRDGLDCATLRDAADAIERSVAEVERLRAILNTPEIDDFVRGVTLEAQHQRARWGSAHDAGKENADWFWLIGYLAGKTLAAANAGNSEKALHHAISTAAALANWHAAISGASNAMRPGIDSDAARAALPPGPAK